jgi:hypothetical protein
MKGFMDVITTIPSLIDIQNVCEDLLRTIGAIIVELELEDIRSAVAYNYISTRHALARLERVPLDPDISFYDTWLTLGELMHRLFSPLSKDETPEASVIEGCSWHRCVLHKQHPGRIQTMLREKDGCFDVQYCSGEPKFSSGVHLFILKLVQYYAKKSKR